ncbi:PaaI family thioesterase [Janibacter cremeus]|uniref:Acyl-coenzyme A thioesterase PaaI-like protein n=1 Tax=Janibacter cremeus TaxID=1285192 RepID=A0A852VX99_9MICO|nr:PaaI family thioesterase [Janibacter cremeus]NYF99283.1 acyl-coenzyme A thioesterase PaaI-like protein [Janibacter cremeus]
MTDGVFASPATVEDPDALAATEQAQGDLAVSLREMVDACVRTRVDDDTLTAVAQEVRTLTQRLLVRAQSEPLGLETTSGGRLRDHGNPMAGMRNPIAPPLAVTGDTEGTMSATFCLGAGYEGPPGCVHGGMIAAVLDQVVGSAPARVGRPGLTAYLNTTYRRPTLLGIEHVARAWVEEVDGWKVRARGDIRDPQGRVTAEADALFVVPRWAREHLGTPTGDAGGVDPGDTAAHDVATS